MEVATLFDQGFFALHSGKFSDFKINCDALGDKDWECIAYLISQRIHFGEVEGVPTGGLRLAEQLELYCEPRGPLLIVDDVLTSGANMEEQRDGRVAVGFVVFARGICPPWVRALFTMN